MANLNVWHLLDEGTVLQISNDPRHTNDTAVVHWSGFDKAAGALSDKRRHAHLMTAAPLLRDALIEARTALAVAIRANIQSATEHDVGGNLIIRRIDAALAAAELKR